MCSCYNLVSSTIFDALVGVVATAAGGGGGGADVSLQLAQSVAFIIVVDVFECAHHFSNSARFLPTVTQYL